MKVVGDIYGETLPGIPTPRLAEAGGGEAYFVPNKDERSSIPGVWYLRVKGQYEAPDGKYRRVRVVADPYTDPTR